MNGSGNILADRRFAWARALAHEGDHAAAADLLLQVVDLAPGWGAAWAALAEARQGAGDRVSAAAAWKRAAALDEDGRLGAGLQAALFEGRTPAAMPDAYVEALFDGYAPRFEHHLVEHLDYRGPQLILDALAQAAPSCRFGEALDLGCGTGLMGRALRDHVGALDGVDLSARMVDVARGRNLYRTLWVAPLLDVLAGSPPGRYDLVTAADVLVYVGDLVPLMAGVARVLAPGGLFSFTTQSALQKPTGLPSAPVDPRQPALDTEPPPFMLGADLRFSHSRPYVERTLAAFGLQPAAMTDAWARTENRVGIPGLVVVARRP